MTGSRSNLTGSAADKQLREAQDAVMEELRAASNSERRLPDFFIAGHAKCGTTALYGMLSAHPQIYMSAVKEPEYLSRAPQHRLRGPSEPAKRLPDTLERYLALFADASPDQLAGEASTEYLRTPGTAARIAALCPDARIIAMFREPVSFVRSLHLQLLQVGVETESDFVKATGLEADRRAGRHVPRECRWPPALLYSEHVHYTRQLREYHEHFGRERVLTLIYDDFLADNERVMREVLRFLAVDETIAIEPTTANPTLRVRSQRGERLVNAVSVGKGPVSRTLKRTLKTVLPERVRKDAHRKAVRLVIDTEPAPPPEEFIEELRHRFAGEVSEVSEYLERDLVKLWGYETLS